MRRLIMKMRSQIQIGLLKCASVFRVVVQVYSNIVFLKSLLRYDILHDGHNHFKSSGLNSLTYRVEKFEERRTHTWILVDIIPDKVSFKLQRVSAKIYIFTYNNSILSNNRRIKSPKLMSRE